MSHLQPSDFAAALTVAQGAIARVHFGFTWQQLPAETRRDIILGLQNVLLEAAADVQDELQIKMHCHECDAFGPVEIAGTRGYCEKCIDFARAMWTAVGGGL